MKKEKFCLYCKKPKTGKGKYFCSRKCYIEYNKKIFWENYKADNSIAYGQMQMRSYKKYFLEDQNHKCAICGMPDVWNNKPITFVLDHIDGDACNNNYNNLRLICPNCDSQLNTFKSKNANSTRKRLYNRNKEYGKYQHKEIICIDTKQTFINIQQVIEWLYNTQDIKASKEYILDVCKRKGYSAYGYRWAFVGEEQLELEWFSNKHIHEAKHVFCNELNRRFESIKEAASWVYNNKKVNGKIDTIKGHIRQVCHGRRKSAYGYHWEFVED